MERPCEENQLCSQLIEKSVLKGSVLHIQLIVFPAEGKKV